MKAQEVLRRYAAGERDFRGANLRGANFKGQELNGADFSGADIRSANFSNATLESVSFAKAQAGLQKRQILMRIILLTVLSAVIGTLYGFVGTFSASFLDEKTGVIETKVLIAALVAALIITFLQGFTLRAIYSTLFMIVLIVAMVGVVLVLFTGSPEFAVYASGGAAIVCTVAILGVNIAICISSIAFVATYGNVYASSYIAIITIISGISTARVLASGGAVRSEDALIIAQMTVLTLLLLGIYLGKQALKEKENLLFVWRRGIRIGVVGGTLFCGAKLTGSDFYKARLRSVNFASSHQHSTILTHVRWQEAKHLKFAHFGTAILRDRRVRTLLDVSKSGYKQDLSNANLRSANLSGLTLENANLTRAILSNARLHKTMLEGATLTEVQAVGADLTDAYLTGATLEGWNIDSTTVLKDIDCRYVFLLEKPNQNGDQERRPHDPKKDFQPGDFEKFFKEMLDEVQILIRNGIHPTAFRAAFQSIMQQNPNITPDAITGYEKRGADVMLTLQVPEGTNKADLEHAWEKGYQTGLKAGRDAEKLESVDFLKQTLLLSAGQNNTFVNENKLMTGNDQSQNIDVKGDFTVTANQSVVSLRDISGQVNNQLAQLSDEPTQTQLKDLLTQLQTAIEAEPALTESQKTEALEEVKELAAAGQAPQDGPMKKAAKRALTVLKGMTIGLGKTTKFVEACNGLLPAIGTLFAL